MKFQGFDPEDLHTYATPGITTPVFLGSALFIALWFFNGFWLAVKVFAIGFGLLIGTALLMCLCGVVIVLVRKNWQAFWASRESKPE